MQLERSDVKRNLRKLTGFKICIDNKNKFLIKFTNFCFPHSFY